MKTKECYICKTPLIINSYVKWYDKTMHKVEVCSKCNTSFIKELSTYPVKGLHYGNNS